MAKMNFCLASPHYLGGIHRGRPRSGTGGESVQSGQSKETENRDVYGGQKVPFLNRRFYRWPLAKFRPITTLDKGAFVPTVCTVRQGNSKYEKTSQRISRVRQEWP